MPTYKVDPAQHWFDRIISAWLVLQRAVCICGWRSRARWSGNAAANDLLLHQAMTGTEVVTPDA